MRSLIALIRSRFSPEEYLKFKNTARLEILLKTYEEIKKDQGDIATKKMVALEIIQKLSHGLKKRGVALPDELAQIQRELEPKSPLILPPLSSGAEELSLNKIKTKVSIKQGQLIGKEVVSNFNLAYTILNAFEDIIKLFKNCKKQCIQHSQTQFLGFMPEYRKPLQAKAAMDELD